MKLTDELQEGQQGIWTASLKTWKFTCSLKLTAAAASQQHRVNSKWKHKQHKTHSWVAVPLMCQVIQKKRSLTKSCDLPWISVSTPWLLFKHHKTASAASVIEWGQGRMQKGRDDTATEQDRDTVQTGEKRGNDRQWERKEGYEGKEEKYERGRNEEKKGHLTHMWVYA